MNPHDSPFDLGCRWYNADRETVIIMHSWCFREFLGDLTCDEPPINVPLFPSRFLFRHYSGRAMSDYQMSLQINDYT